MQILCCIRAINVKKHFWHEPLYSRDLSQDPYYTNLLLKVEEETFNHETEIIERRKIKISLLKRFIIIARPSLTHYCLFH
jgi:hypothetical protein